MHSTSTLQDGEPRTDQPTGEAEFDESEALETEFDESEALERPAPATPTMVVPVVVPPTRRPTDDDDDFETIPPQRKLVLDHLLSMAEQYASSGSFRQAIELYFTLVVEHGGSDQAVQACDRLIAIAEGYQKHGELRLARGIYERVLKAS